MNFIGLCGNAELLGDGTPQLKLPTNRPLVFIERAPDGFTVDDVWGWLKEAHARWGAVCDWQARRIMNMSEASQTDLVQYVTVADLGTGGVLADQMLYTGSSRVLRNRINGRIHYRATDGPMASGTIDPIRTETHETGHFMGHQHWPVGLPDELMEPMIKQHVIGPQPTEAEMSGRWYGKPPVVPPQPGPGADYSTVRIAITRAERIVITDANGRPAKIVWE